MSAIEANRFPSLLDLEMHTAPKVESMYQSFFGLRDRPFVSIPNVRHYVPLESIQLAHEALNRCVVNGNGPGLLIGQPGTGKTLLLRKIESDLRTSASVVYLFGGHLATRRVLLQSILFELGLPFRDMDDAELRLALTNHVKQLDDSNLGVILLVDEAHGMSSRVLEELRVLGELLINDRPQVRVILAGTAGLEERLAAPELSALSQRIAARCYLSTLNQTDTQQFLDTQLKRASADEPLDIFTEAAVKAVYRATDGIPRLINQLAEHALYTAYAAGDSRITGESVADSWADLQQLPSPTLVPEWTASSAAHNPPSDSQSVDNVVEFGLLAESEDASNDSISTASAVANDELVEQPNPNTESELHVEPIHGVMETTVLEVIDMEDDSSDELGMSSDSAHEKVETRKPIVDRPRLEAFRVLEPAALACNPFDEEFEYEEDVVDPADGQASWLASMPSPEAFLPYPYPRAEDFDSGRTEVEDLINPNKIPVESDNELSSTRIEAEWDHQTHALVRPAYDDIDQELHGETMLETAEQDSDLKVDDADTLAGVLADCQLMVDDPTEGDASRDGEPCERDDELMVANSLGELADSVGEAVKSIDAAVTPPADFPDRLHEFEDPNVSLEATRDDATGLVTNEVVCEPPSRQDADQGAVAAAPLPTDRTSPGVENVGLQFDRSAPVDERPIERDSADDRDTSPKVQQEKRTFGRLFANLRR